MLRNRVRETSTSTGTGDFQLNGPVDITHKTFFSAFGDGGTGYYTIVHSNGIEYEIGICTAFNDGRISRDSVLESSNGNNLVAFTVGPKQVFNGMPYEYFTSTPTPNRAILADGSGKIDLGWLDGVAPLDSPSFTGTPTAPTPDHLDNSSKLATTEYVKTVINDLINGAPTLLDTLGEIAAALEDDEDALAALILTVDGKQALNANLTAFSGLTNSADKLGYFTGSSNMAVTDLTAFGRQIIACTDLAAAQTLLGITTGAGTGSVTSVDVTPPASGFTITGGPITASGTFVFSLADDLNSLENLTTNGIAVRSATSTWTTRTLTGTSNQIDIADGDGVSGNPTFSFPSTVIFPGTISASNLSGSNTGDQDLSGLVPNTRTVNGHALSSNVTVTASDLGLGSVENTALSTWAGSTNVTTLGTIGTGVWNGTTIDVGHGGTGQTSYVDGQLLIGNSTGNTLTKATLSGTTNQIVVTNGSGSITLSTPQNIDTAATPQFAKLGLGAAASTALLTFPSGTAAAGGITFGDTNLYRVGTTALKTDGGFISATFATSGDMTLGGKLIYQASISAYNTADTTPLSYNSASSGAGYPFLEAGNLVHQSRPSTNCDIIFVNRVGSTQTECLVLNRAGNALFGTVTVPTSATWNIVLAGGSTTPVLGAATADMVNLAAVDKTGGDRRLYIQSELGSTISLGNDRLNFTAAIGNISIAGTDAVTVTAAKLQMTNAAAANDTNTAIFQLSAGADVSLSAMSFVVGLRPSATGGNRYGYFSVGDSVALRMFCLNFNGTSVFGNVGVGTITPSASATQNFIIGGPATSPVLGSATADQVNLAAVDKAAGDRRLYIQAELGSSISFGNDRLNYLAASGIVSINGTDVTTTSAGLLTVSGAASGGIDTRLQLSSPGNGGSNRGTAILIRGPGSASDQNLVKLIAVTTGGATVSQSADFVIQTALSGTLTEYARLTSIGNLLFGTAVTPTSATFNMVYGGGTTSPVLGAATADYVNTCGFDRINTRHAAAGNRLLSIQSERGSPIYIGDDGIDFAATSAVISLNGSDPCTINANGFQLGARLGVGVAPSGSASALICAGGNPTNFTSANYINVTDGTNGGALVMSKDSTNYAIVQYSAASSAFTFATVEAGTAYTTSIGVKSGNVIVGGLAIPASATRNLVLSGGATSPVIGAATADMVNLAAVDATGGDRRLYIQSELGSTISLGNDRLNYAASTGVIQIGGTNVIVATSSLVTFTQAFSVAKNQNAGLDCTISNSDTGTSAFARYVVQANGVAGNLIAYGATYVGGAQYQSNMMLYTSSTNALLLGINSAEVARITGTGQNFQLGTATTPTSATYNIVLGGGSTSPVIGAATADMVNLCGFDRVNTRHAAAGNRLLAVQGERGSTIYLGDDAIDFAATTALISVNATDMLSMTSSVISVTDAKDLAFGTSTGTKLGTSTSQKLGLWNATPVAQYSSAATLTTGFTAGAGTPVLAGSTFTGNVGSTAYTISEVVNALKSCGIMAA